MSLGLALNDFAGFECGSGSDDDGASSRWASPCSTAVSSPGSLFSDLEMQRTHVSGATPRERIFSFGKAEISTPYLRLSLTQPSWAAQAVRRPSAAHFRALARSVAVLVATILLCASPWIMYGRQAVEHCDANLMWKGRSHGSGVADLRWKWLVVAAVVALWVLAGLFCAAQLQWWYTSAHLVSIRWHVFAAWVISATTVYLEIWVWCDLPEHLLVAHSNTFKVRQQMSSYRLCWLFLITTTLIFFSWHFQLIADHLRRLEYAFNKCLGAVAMRYTVFFNYFTALLLFFVNFALDTRENCDALRAVDALASIGPLFSWILLLVLGTRGFWMSFSFAKREAKHCCRPLEKQTAMIVVRRARWIFAEAAPSMLSIILAVAAWFRGGGPGLSLYRESLFVLMSQITLIVASRFVMILSGIGPLGPRQVLKPCCSQGRPQKDLADVDAGVEWSSGHAEWDAKVRELGLRGFTLAALLDFYWSLGSVDVMPHFDRRAHTTADVVRQAIIPTTRGTQYGDCSLSMLIMQGQQVLPNRLVTHTWSNLFSHLVAAIVADALDSPTYEHLVARLADPLERHALKAELYWKGKMDETYWVCAVSVNQHTCICNTLHGRACDSATGVAFDLCQCETTKYLSNTPPTRSAAGLSIDCEVNKFDDMMLWLASVNPGFSQCIAVDDRFNLFSRAWCVAELHRAYSADMLQTLRLFSEENLERHENWLKRLRVEEMEASNPADKAMILSRIGNKQDFNEELQNLIFSDDGLLNTWRGGLDLASALGVLARRAEARIQASADGTAVKDAWRPIVFNDFFQWLGHKAS
eukprot:TRINITY_DN12295_c0_g1_i1.p1 TRINITY_DN12295_c0_g1~~TRINITY_DN12295_c0_g1_i1.p1  ORF type:complete len:811 (-),score=73.63 TRINITY_DN12295_c0_g1_i1:330-2762(-)